MARDLGRRLMILDVPDFGRGRVADRHLADYCIERVSKFFLITKADIETMNVVLPCYALQKRTIEIIFHEEQLVSYVLDYIEELELEREAKMVSALYYLRDTAPWCSAPAEIDSSSSSSSSTKSSSSIRHLDIGLQEHNNNEYSKEEERQLLEGMLISVLALLNNLPGPKPAVAADGDEENSENSEDSRRILEPVRQEFHGVEHLRRSLVRPNAPRPPMWPRPRPERPLNLVIARRQGEIGYLPSQAYFRSAEGLADVYCTMRGRPVFIVVDTPPNTNLFAFAPHGNRHILSMTRLPESHLRLHQLPGHFVNSQDFIIDGIRPLRRQNSLSYRARLKFFYHRDAEGEDFCTIFSEIPSDRAFASRGLLLFRNVGCHSCSGFNR